MAVTIRAYRDPEDFDLVYRFLDEIYEPGDQLRAWLPARWEYACFHPLIEGIDLETTGIAQAGDGTVVGVANPEFSPAFGTLQIRPGHEHIKEALLDWVESHFGGWASSLGRDVVGVYVNDADEDLGTIMTERGYEQLPEWAEPYARMRLGGLPLEAPVPPGFRLQSLADENDLRKINQVLWRGFDHEGPPPADELPGRARMQQPPRFREDHNIVAVAPDGMFVAYAGIWHMPDHGVGYVEPVATDPDYRRMGLGKAVVLEAIRRVQELGAAVAWVGSDQPFYLSLGFEVVDRATPWYRAF